jgi:hypothetical protein
LDDQDGYNKNGTPDADDRTYLDANHEEGDFVMLKVKIDRSDVDLSPNHAWVWIDYLDDSPDLDVASQPDPPNQHPGRIRLWKRPGDEPRDRHSALPDEHEGEGEGDWIAPGTYTDLRQLMPGNGTASHEMTFYIEGTQVSQSLGDVKIRFHLDPDGDGPAGWVHMDTVQVTVVRVNIETDSDNNGTINAADNMVEDEFPGRAMWPNADNDNVAGGNTQADMDETGTVAGENDLAEIRVDVLPELANLMVKLEVVKAAPSDLDLVKVWLQADKTTLAPMQWNAQELPYTLWVEGLGQAGTATLTLSLVSSPGAKDSVKMTVFRVCYIYWDAHYSPLYGSNCPLSICPKNGGWRNPVRHGVCLERFCVTVTSWKHKGPRRAE